MVSSPISTSIKPKQKPILNPFSVFLLSWIVIFLVYLPAARAGFVSDFTGWLDQVRNHSFAEFVNRNNFHQQSLYQFTQFTSYVLYHLLGTNPWLWHLLFISLHALNCSLIFSIAKKLLDGPRTINSNIPVLAGILLFCVSPYISEVIVWEASYHYLIGLLFILLIIRQLQKYYETPHAGNAWVAAILYTVSTFSIEIFYITPWLTAAYILYQYKNGYGRKQTRPALLYFFLPQLLLFLLHLVLFHIVYGSWVAHIGDTTIISSKLSCLGKPVKYLYHIIFLGRFFPDAVNAKVYAFCDSAGGVVLFFLLAIAAFVIPFLNRMSNIVRTTLLFFTWAFFCLCLLCPLWFFDSMLVIGDRYTYFADCFFYMFVALALRAAFPGKRAYLILIIIIALINLRFTIKESRFWWKSSRIITGLLNNFPPSGNKTVVLLNIPSTMHGIPMIGATAQGEYKLMHNLLLPERKITNIVYDGLGYNMITPEDGAHVEIINDSTVRVILNQWGTWWWYNGFGANSYENSDYKLDLKDPGHFYELTLKKPHDNYVLLYELGDKWYQVAWPSNK